MHSIQLSRSASPLNISRTIFSILAVSVAAANIADASVVETGTNNPEPVASGTANDYSIGWGATGTLTINGGTQFTTGSLSAGDRGTGNGTILIDGAGTKVTFNPVGQTNVLQPGNWGIGSVTISGGAIVDGTNVASCAAGWCSSFISNGAGSTGTLGISGAGSTLSLPNSFVVGHDVVVKNITTGSVFGTPGGASSGIVNVTSGGTLNTQDATIGVNANIFPPPGGVYQCCHGNRDGDRHSCRRRNRLDLECDVPGQFRDGHRCRE
jgi:hypothetical protein